MHLETQWKNIEPPRPHSEIRGREGKLTLLPRLVKTSRDPHSSASPGAGAIGVESGCIPLSPVGCTLMIRVNTGASSWSRRYS